MKKSIKKLTGRLAFAALIGAVILGSNLNPVIAYGNTDESPGKISQKIEQLKQQNVFKQESKVFSVADKSSNESLSETVRNYTLLKVNEGLSEILNNKPEYLKLIIPIENGARNLTVLLYKVNISPNGFTLLTSDGLSQPVENPIVNYRGRVDNDSHSIAAVTFSDNETMGIISNNEGNYVLGKIENNHTGMYMIYNDRDLVQPFNFECATSTVVPKGYSQQYAPPGTLSTKCVNWYWETDYDIYVGKGSSVANVNSYIQGIFNQVSTLYDNDGMSITLLTLFIWSTTDPYIGPSTSDYLDQFGTNRTSFNGNLANLIGYAGGGGIAWLNGFCASTSHKMAYSGISSGYNTVPTYSWTVEVLAHEEGHLFGSHHTHGCVWNGNNTAIDGCGPQAGYNYEGSCSGAPIPPNGGTIMSYCHLIGTGINFSLGFGPQPGALMLNNENNSSCLTACSGCTPPSQPGTISGSASPCQSSSQQYSVTSVSGASSYTWTLPSGWTGASTTTSITTTAGSAGGNITVTANNSCGSSAVRTLAVTVSTLPAQPGTISGSISVCQSSSHTYSVSAVTGATSYTWTLPSGWTGSSTTTSITSTAGNSGGNITVIANNSCGSSAVRTLAVTTLTTPSQPGTISGTASACQSSSQTYSITAVAGATSYTWTLPSGWAGSSTTTSITSTAGSAGGNITVKANNSCGSSAVRTLAVTVLTLPAQPGTISGSAAVCQSASQTYSITAVAGATSYTWTLPSGWTGSSTTTSITSTSGSAGGNITVKANNSCGSSAVRTLAVTVIAVPAQPGSISGNATICESSSQTYSVTAVAGATSYTWTLPSGWTGSSTTTSITSTAGSTGGNITVKANNSCGSSPVRTSAVSVITLPASPGTITRSGGRNKVCPGETRTYSVILVSGNTYNWTVPVGAGITSGQGTNTIEVTYGNNFLTAGTIDVTAVNSCGAGPASSIVIKRRVPAMPANISGPVSVCNGSVTTYFAAAVPAASSYKWTVPAGAVIQGAQTGISISVLWGSTGGNITVKASNTCADSDPQLLAVNVTCREVGINTADGLKAEAFPNPTDGKITLKFSADNESIYTISIKDITGRILKKEKIKSTIGDNLNTFDLGGFSKGIYFVRIENVYLNQLLKISVQ